MKEKCSKELHLLPKGGVPWNPWIPPRSAYDNCQFARSCTIIDTIESTVVRIRQPQPSGVSKVGHGRAFALPTAAESNFNTALKSFK